MVQPRQLAIALSALVALALLSDGLGAQANRAYGSAQRYQDVYYLPPPGWLRTISLGWNEALADLLWMRALVYFGDEVRNQGTVRHVFDYAEAIAALDPRFRAVYHWVGMAALYHAGNVPPSEVERAASFMERGARVFPEDGELAWDVGATLVFELAPVLSDEDAKRAALERGTPYLLTASRLGAAPEWAALSNATILARVGHAQQAAAHLEEMYLSVHDPAVRAEIAERIRDLRSAAEEEAFVASMHEVEDARVRDFPYVDPTLYLHLGPRPPLDTATPFREGFAHALTEP